MLAEGVEARAIAGLRFAPELEARVGSPLEVSDLVGDTGSFDTRSEERRVGKEC